MSVPRTVGLLAAVSVLAAAASATNVPVAAKKLIVVDKLMAAGKAKTVFVAKDAAITKGAGLFNNQIDVQFDLAYGNGSAVGAFTIPSGWFDGTAGWLTAGPATVADAKYVNKDAPSGATQAKVALIKSGKLLKLVGKGLGDTPFDILMAGDPAGSVFTAFCVRNQAEENCHCSVFSACIHKSIAGGTGAKLLCKMSLGDPVCTAAGP